MSKKRQKKRVLSNSRTPNNRVGLYDMLEAKYRAYKDKCSFVEGREEIERFLKNEAYSFLLAEGIIDKFLEYREAQQTKQQGAAYFLVVNANLEGLWIDV